MEELLDPILLPDRVHVGDLVLGDGGEVQVHLHHGGDHVLYVLVAVAVRFHQK